MQSDDWEKAWEQENDEGEEVKNKQKRRIIGILLVLALISLRVSITMLN